MLTVRGNDPVGIAFWAELAAQGFHVVAAVPQPDGGSVLYLERMAGMRGEALRLPTLIEQDPTAAAALRAKVQAAQADRQRQASSASGSQLPTPPVDGTKP